MHERLQQLKMDVPDMIPMPMCSRFNNVDPEASAALKRAPANVQSFLLSATHSTDDPLPVALPHASAINQLRRAKKPIPDGTIGPGEWPEGCLGYAFNLVRPAAGHEGIRQSLFWTLLSRTLVFTTLETAENYREAVLRLSGGCGDIISLDGRKVRSSGIVCGSSFEICSLAVASYRFACLPSTQVRPPTYSDFYFKIK